MQFQYGNYSFPIDSVAITGFTSSFVRSQTGRAHLLKKQMSCKGKFIGTSRSDISAQLALAQLAMSINGQPAVMYDDFGNVTPFNIDSASSVGGVIVTQGLSNREVMGAQGITYMWFTFAIEADYLWAGNNDVLSFQETLSFHDNQGLPLQIERVPAVGLPIIQNITQTSFYYATQAGTLTQVGANPQPMPAIFPGLFRGTPDSNSVSLMSPQTVRGTPIAYGIQWKYEYISISPFFGYPNVR